MFDLLCSCGEYVSSHWVVIASSKKKRPLEEIKEQLEALPEHYANREFKVTKKGDVQRLNQELLEHSDRIGWD